jgi:putative solute:sodium symporter small subunit
MNKNAHWHYNLKWIAGLLCIWVGVTFGVSWFADILSFSFAGWPFAYWVGAQGALLVYVLITALYAWAMNRADSSKKT